MVKALLLALGAGAASALLGGTVASGSPIGLMLVYLTPLPLIIIGLGWHSLLALLGGIFACLALSLALDGRVAIFFAALVVIPAWGLAELMGRPQRSNSDAGGAAFVSPGVVLLAIAGYAVAVTLVGALFVDTSYDALHQQLTRAAEEFVRLRFGLADDAPLKFPDGSDASGNVSFLAAFFPVAMATGLSAFYVLNAWLAALVVRRSGLLRRPWPDLRTLDFPRGTALALGAVFAATMLPGYPGLAATLATATLVLAFGFLGFAVLHMITAGMPMRGLVLSLAWIMTLAFGFPALLAAGLGLAEQIFGLRARRRASPPRPPSS